MRDQTPPESEPEIAPESEPAIAPAAAPDPTGDTRRQRLGLMGELSLAALPTVTIILVLWLVEAFAERQVLFASLASSAFLIYRDPEHRMNSARVLLFAQVLAAGIGFAVWSWLGSSYLAAGLALGVATFAMVALDIVHPPAIGTALSFAYRPGDDDNFALFLVALLLVVVLTGLSTATTWTLRRLMRES